MICTKNAHVAIPPTATREQAKSYLWVFGVPLQILAVDQRLDALLQVGALDGEFEHLHELPNQQPVAQGLPRLHHPHRSGIDLQQHP